MIVYCYRVVTFPSGEKRLVMDLAGEQYDALGYFLDGDIFFHEDEILDIIDEILAGKREEYDMAGNLCVLNITAENTHIYIQYDRDVITDISTEEFREVVAIWLKAKKAFKEKYKEYNEECKKKWVEKLQKEKREKQERERREKEEHDL